MLLRAYAWLGIMEAFAAMMVFFFVLYGAGWRYGERFLAGDPVSLQATTACLSAIIVMQVVNLFLCRSERASAFDARILRNRLIFLGLATEIALIRAIDYTAWGNHGFGTAPISLDVWLFVIPFALAMLLLEELRKLLVRRWQGETRT